MEFDALLTEVGSFGRYQKWVTGTLSLLTLLAATQLYVQVFIAGESHHWCRSWPDEECHDIMTDKTDCEILKRNMSIPFSTDVNGGVTFDQCVKYDVDDIDFQKLHESGGIENGTVDVIPCDNGWVYDNSVFSDTIIEEFELVCNRSHYPNYAQSAYFAGYMAGNLVTGVAADFIGRQRMVLIATLFAGLSSAGVALSLNVWMFICLRFMTACFAIVTISTGFILCNEIVEPSKRVVVGNMLWITFALAYALLAGLAKLVYSWRVLQLAISFPYLFMFVISFFSILESPRWLISKNRHKQADRVLRQMAKFNNKRLRENFSSTNCRIADQGEVLGFKPFLMAVVARSRFIMIVLNLGFNWMVHSFVYYGLSLSTSSLGIDPYISFIVSGAIEIPAYSLCMVLPEIFGRKVITVSCMLLGGATCCLAVVFPLGILKTVVAMLGKFFITISYSVVYGWGSELVPTPLRSSAIGLFSACSRIGSVIAPLMLILEDTWQNLPAIVFGSLSIIAGILALFLVETKGSQLPSTLRDMNNLYSKKTVEEDNKDDYAPHEKEKVSVENPSFEHT